MSEGGILVIGLGCVIMVLSLFLVPFARIEEAKREKEWDEMDREDEEMRQEDEELKKEEREARRKMLAKKEIVI